MKCTSCGIFYRHDAIGMNSELQYLNESTYAIEPQEKPTSRKPSSDIERAVGAPNPSVISFVGTIESFLLHLNKFPDVEK